MPAQAASSSTPYPHPFYAAGAGNIGTNNKGNLLYGNNNFG